MLDFCFPVEGEALLLRGLRVVRNGFRVILGLYIPSSFFFVKIPIWNFSKFGISTQKLAVSSETEVETQRVKPVF